jgi:hypothetical protein
MRSGRAAPASAAPELGSAHPEGAKRSLISDRTIVPQPLGWKPDISQVSYPTGSEGILLRLIRAWRVSFQSFSFDRVRKVLRQELQGIQETGEE